ncbi:MAG: hypothetical protein IJP70_08670 [Bacteroidales bacterium]|nr:hypothetical protein [Bacteroidales bacterium]
MVLLLSLLADSTSSAQTTIRGSVYGGGEEADVKTNSEVNITNGKISGNVYGGGKMGSVGTISDSTRTVGIPGEMTMGEMTIPTVFGFVISVPYTFTYPVDSETGETTTGLCTVNITGGIINGDVFGAARGQAGESYAMAHVANIRKAVVNIGTEGSTSNTTPDIRGSVYGGGENGHTIEDAYVTIYGGKIGKSVFGSGKGTDKYDKTLKSWEDNSEYPGKVYSLTAGKVYGNAYVEMKGGQVLGNVYGGGKLASIGKGNYSGGADDYFPMGYGETIKGNLWDGISNESKDFLSSGKATVKITGGIVGTIDGIDEDGRMPTGNVFGGSQGEAAPNIFNQPADDYNPVFHVANINEAIVIIGTKDQTTSSETAGTTGEAPRIYGSVYGGGQDGHMRRDAKVTVYSGEIGNAYNGDGSDLDDLQWQHRGNVFGAGSGFGLYTFDYDHDGVLWTDENGNGKYDDGEEDTYEYHDTIYHDMGVSYLAGCIARFSEVDIQGGIIHHNVYGGGSVAGTGEPKFGYQTYEPFRKGDTGSDPVYGKHSEGKQSMNTVTVSGGIIGQEGYGGDVYGASRGNEALLLADERLTTTIWTEVNILGGTIYHDVYGGGELGTVKQDTKVNLLGGEIKGDAYGGGKGTSKVAADIGSTLDNPPYLGGNTLVELNNNSEIIDGTKKGCIVNRIFGCNNVNGTPKGNATVHIYATQNAAASTIANPEEGEQTAKVEGRYDVAAVYGGGNQAAYMPTNALLPYTDANKAMVDATYAQVIIDGCELTSIQQVYGGGNAASTPATSVTINGNFEIEEVFGGGNGKDSVIINGVKQVNPGANVGYKAYSVAYDPPASSKTERQSLFGYGSGKAAVNIFGGTVHCVFGGSNTKGNVCHTAVTMLEEGGGCTFNIDEAYGGGKSAPMDAEAQLLMACIPGLKEVYGGAEAADIMDDVTLNITNGTFNRVFGGNNISGTIHGNIQVNIEETGCKPIIIGELYGGGNRAAYSVYGYKLETEGEGDNAVTRLIAIEDPDDPEALTGDAIADDPQVNVKSCTSIGNIYGGGYGNEAVMVGNPIVNINEVVGNPTTYPTDGKFNSIGFKGDTITIDGHQVIRPSHVKGKIGAIGNVFGGGNAAKVIGNTQVNIGTQSSIDYITKGADEEAPLTGISVVGADIRGNVYGGGNEAEVTGNTSVKIGKNADE